MKLREVPRSGSKKIKIIGIRKKRKEREIICQLVICGLEMSLVTNRIVVSLAISEG
jgi:hypothetical protein